MEDCIKRNQKIKGAKKFNKYDTRELHLGALVLTL